MTQHPARVALPIIGPRAVVVWAVGRLLIAVLPLAIGGSFGALPPSPIAVVLVAVTLGLVDVRVRGERILWANLGVTPVVLGTLYGAAAAAAESGLAMVLR